MALRMIWAINNTLITRFALKKYVSLKLSGLTLENNKINYTDDCNVPI